MTSGVQYFTGGVLTDQWDDVTNGGQYTQWNASGTLIRGPIAYTALATGDPAYPIAQAAPQRLASMQAATNYQNILNAIATQRQNNSNYLNIASPTNAQVIAQVAALTHQNNAMMRLDANDLTGTN